MPHDFGRNRSTPIKRVVKLKAETDLVETLGNMQISDEILENTAFQKDWLGNATHPLDAQMRSLGLREAVPPDKKQLNLVI